MFIVDQSSKARHVTFEDEEAEAEEYVSITRNEIKLMLEMRKAIKYQTQKCPVMSLFQ